MPLTFAQLRSSLEGLGFHIMVPAGQDLECGMQFETRSYTDTDGDHSLLLVCRLEEQGAYLEVYAPNAYSTVDCKYKAALFACMLQISLQTKHLQLEHDASDGEVRFSVDMPVCDGTVTPLQLQALVFCLIRSLEEFHPVLRHAMTTGKIDFGLRWAPPAQRTSSSDTPAIAPELQELIERVGGLDNLEALIVAERAKGRGT